MAASRPPNRASREASLSPSGGPNHYLYPQQTRAMDKADIRAFLRWQANAARRARQAGFDIVYCYAGHGYLPFQFISPRWNRRSDEYGGSIANRARLLREMIEVTKEAVGDKCAVAVRLAMDELMGEEGVTFEREGREVVSLLAELPDLWDVNISYVENDSMSARFSEEGFQERYVAEVKKLTSKPVVGVGRFTSPDMMVSQIRRGVLDLIGAARPSIADPWLPRKIAEGREDEIRECIGCNICRAHNNMGVPIRCTQNPTMGEEYRRGWHPERVPAAKGHADGFRAGGRRRAGRAGMRHDPGQARLSGHAGRSAPGAGRARDAGEPPAGPLELGPGARLPHRARSAGSPMWRCFSRAGCRPPISPAWIAAM